MIKLRLLIALAAAVLLAVAACDDDDRLSRIRTTATNTSYTGTGTGSGTGTSTSTSGLSAYIEITWVNSGTWDNMIIYDSDGEIMVDAGCGTGGTDVSPILPSEEAALTAALDNCNWSFTDDPLVLGSTSDFPVFMSEVKAGKPDGPKRFTVYGSPVDGAEYKAAANCLYDVWLEHRP